MRVERLIPSGYFSASSLLILMLLAAPVLLAQERDLRVELFGGASFLKAQRTFLVNQEAFRTEFSDGGKVGLRGTVNLGSHLAVEGAYSYGTSNLRVLDLEAVPLHERGFGVRVHQLSGNVLWFLNEQGHTLRPFVTAGLGLARFSPTSDARSVATANGFIAGPAAVSASNELDLNLGAGMEGKLTRLLGVRLDLRDHVTRFPRFGLSKEFFPAAGAAQELEISLGVVLHLAR